MVDVVIVGGGVCGCSLLYELSRYKLSAVLVEKENDVSVGTTKANSAIVHAGYDPHPGTTMARYNVEGNALVKELCEKLDVPYKQIGSLVLAFDADQDALVRELFDRGTQNGVPGMKVLSAAEVREMEPNVSPEVTSALYAPSAGIVSPWELAIALAETAVKNGAQVELNSEVTSIQPIDGGFRVTAGGKEIDTRFVVNAAGIWSDKINDMAAPHTFTVSANKGEYFLLDKSQGTLVNHVIFQCPSKVGKGVLVSPTVHGNLIVGPNAEDAEKDDLGTTGDGLAFVRKMALRSVPDINFRDSIRNFAGLRANTEIDDFLVGETEQKGFFNIAGIKSPGLTSAPAIARDVVRMLGKAGLTLDPKETFVDERHVVRFKHLSHEERAAAIAKNPLYGQIVCRCETITEGEIVDALHRPLPPCSIDGVKRRCGSGMGRCQGGFCGPRVQQIIARELGIPQEAVMMDRAGTAVITGETKMGGRTE
ncbi:NAD(P)/FAD-dependent oxidoreductase [Anaeromassilibacillus sp. An200]|uniref:NAD(P)/FAD-dependent oxidoreductase n=1 Tax=Anaeromassilibacillus sp. An200 TaxID=1965587 RepID=UPI000B37AE72|nr:NAD(P)/FAD-dependent oxidoreductase [Anaeromassilibacillus sp. An200]OUP12333.1 FAD/NAD(P)-binding oxidoreductase [Anaeromassilibacillus sp. An200]